MAKLLPFRSEPDVRNVPKLVNIDDEAADGVFAALSSGTARAILGYLYEEPATASDIAEAVDTSLQNARYHLDKLQDAGLVEAVDTWYSSRGTEMTVYAPTSDPLVVTAGREERTSVLRRALSRLVGAVGVLALASALIDRLARTAPIREAVPAATADGAGDAGAGDGTELAVAGNASTTDAPTEVATEAVAETATTSAPTAAGATPEPETTTRTVERTVVETATPAPEATGTELAGQATAGTTPTPAPTPTPAGVEGGVVEAVLATLTNPPPGLLFFAGGLLALVLAAGWWYWFQYRPLYVRG